MPAYEAIGFLSGAGIISGYQNGNFGPGDTLKRGQATKMLVLWQGRAAGHRRASPSPTSTTSIATTWKPPARRAGSPATPTAASSPTPRSPASRWPSSWCGPWAGRRWRSDFPRERSTRSLADFRRPGADLRRRPAVRGDGRVYEGCSAATPTALLKPAGRHHPGAVLPGGRSGRAQPEGGDRGGAQLERLSRPRRGWCIDLSPAPDTVIGRHLRGRHPHHRLHRRGHRRHARRKPSSSPEVTSRRAPARSSYEPRTVRITLDLGRYETFRVMSLAPVRGQGLPHRCRRLPPRRPAPTAMGRRSSASTPGTGAATPARSACDGTPEEGPSTWPSALSGRRGPCARPGCRVMMTRDRTTASHAPRPRRSWRTRRRRACSSSVHNNAAATPGRGGTETFYWGDAEIRDLPRTG